LALFGFVFSAAERLKNLRTLSITSTYVNFGIFKIGFVLHNKAFIARVVLKVNW